MLMASEISLNFEPELWSVLSRNDWLQGLLAAHSVLVHVSQALSKRQRHRGPDWSGTKMTEDSIFVHERLAIVGVGQYSRIIATSHHSLDWPSLTCSCPVLMSRRGSDWSRPSRLGLTRLSQSIGLHRHLFLVPVDIDRHRRSTHH